MDHLRHHFIPHERNNYHAPALHRKRHVLYGSLAIALKVSVIAVSILLPLEVFVTPDVLQKQVDAIVLETNTLRASQGESPLLLDDRLAASAAYKAADMRDEGYFAHMSPSGRGVADLVRRQGYDFQYAGENLSIGYATAKAVVRAWKNSPTHYRNLVHPVFQDIGVGVAVGEVDGKPVPYFVQHFGVEKGSPSEVRGLFVDDTETIVLPQSRVFWRAVPDGVEVHPQVYLNTLATEVVVTHFANDIVLHQEAGVYSTTTLLLTDEDTLFEQILPVSIRIHTIDGEIIESVVPWQDPPMLGPSMIDRYEMAQQYVDDVMPMVIVSRVLLVLLIAGLLLGLLAHLAWSLHEQKHRITFESMWVLVLFILLLVV